MSELMTNHGWIEWHGGKCPLPADTPVEVMTRDGKQIQVLGACRAVWTHVGDNGDIVAYRVGAAPASDGVSTDFLTPRVMADRQPAKPPLGKAPSFSAPDLLDAAAGHMRDRTATYDKPEGERSMGKTVEAFNVITGRDLRESEGWLLMALLKMVRSEQRSDPHRDSIEDLVAYGALFGEARLGGR